MRTLLVAGLFMTVALAGCSDSGGYLLKPSDLGSGYKYADLDSEEYAFFKEFFGMERNPGAINKALFENEEGYNLSKASASIIVFNGTDDVFSALLVFRNAEEARAFAFEDECDDALFAILWKGNRVAIYDAEELPMSELPAFNRAMDKIESRTGAANVCVTQ